MSGIDTIVSDSSGEYRKDTSYHDEFLTSDQLAISFLQQGIIKLSDLVDLIKNYPNDQELGRELRKILNKQGE